MFGNRTDESLTLEEKFAAIEGRLRQAKVKDLMSSELFTLYEDDSVKALKDMMSWRSIRHVPIVNQNDELVGLVTHRDFLRVAVSALAGLNPAEEEDLYRRISVGDIMGKKIATIDPEETLRAAASIMRKHRYGCLPVVENGKLVGILTEADFVRFFCDFETDFLWTD